ncbi:helix-turn-helix transcriptional regulator [Micrococcus terreus]|uniref:helix-turn-helix transcriptional regulator n=1 Tax=Micrococcus terreus TaxID=574650 RepID=UPI003D751FE4
MSENTASQERIVSLLWLLLTAGRVGRTREYLRGHIDAYAEQSSEDAFERMFSRDKETLREIGIPLETVGDAAPQKGTEEGEQTRYRVDRSRLTLPDVQFDDSERLALLRARSLWEGTAAHGAVVRALGRLDREELWLSAAEQADLDTFGARLAGADRRLMQLEEQIRSGAVVTFGYRTAAGGDPAVRTVRPWLLLTAGSQWYLIGWDLDRQDQRMFRVTRFTSEPESVPPGSVTGDVQERPADLDVHEFRRAATGETEPENARLLVAPGAVQWLRVGARDLGPDPTSGPTHGWDQICVEYSRPTEFAGQIAAAGASAVVPSDHPDLRADVHGLLQSALTAQRQPPPRVKLHPVKQTRNRDSDREKVADLVDIVGLVNHRGRMSRTELRERLDLTSAKLDRCIRTLKYCGMPERYFAGGQFEVIDHGEDIEILNAGELDRPIQLTTPEAHALVVGLDLVASVPGLDPSLVEAARRARVKITQALPTQTRGTADAVHVGLDMGPHEDLVADLHRAVQSRTVLELTYHGAGRDEVTRRQVEPLRIETQNGQLYLRAWCRQAQGLRNFRLDRIAGHRWTEHTFSPRPLPADPGLFMAQGDEITVTLRFGHRIKDLADGFHPTSSASLPDGSLVAEVQLSSPDYAFSTVARHGGELTIMAPSPLRNAAEEWLEDALRPYTVT